MKHDINLNNIEFRDPAQGVTRYFVTRNARIVSRGIVKPNQTLDDLTRERDIQDGYTLITEDALVVFGHNMKGEAVGIHIERFKAVEESPVVIA